VSSSISNAEASGLISRATALKELKQLSRITGHFSNITDDDIKEAEMEGPPVPEDVEVAEVRSGALKPDVSGKLEPAEEEAKPGEVKSEAKSDAESKTDNQPKDE